MLGCRLGDGHAVHGNDECGRMSRVEKELSGARKNGNRVGGAEGRAVLY